jgi:hypothetical protein
MRVFGVCETEGSNYLNKYENMQTIDRFVDALFGFDCCFVDGKGFQIEVFWFYPQECAR